MTYDEQQSILSTRGTLRHSVQEVSITGHPDQISVITTPMQQKQQSAVISHVSCQQAGNENANAGAGSFAGHAAYREALHYKLRMFGIPIDSLANILCGNYAVVKNSTFPELTLKQKLNSIAYHHVREAVASKYFTGSKDSKS